MFKFSEMLVNSVLEMRRLFYYMRKNISNCTFPGFIHLVHENDFIYKRHEALKML